MLQSQTDDYKKYACGLILIRSKNSNFNADFAGHPRRLPDEESTIYATDKSLKYCIRRYLKEKADEDIFVWRRKTEEGLPMTAEQNYNFFSEKKESWKKFDESKRPDIVKNLLTCLDVRLFGVTFAPTGEREEKKSASITGPVQISYGINRFSRSEDLTNQILSPYPTKEGDAQTSIGRESKAIESHYVFNFTINPNTIGEDAGFLSEDHNNLSLGDVDLFKEAAGKAVSYVNTSTMAGSENELLLFIESENPGVLMLQNLQDFVTVEPDEKSEKRKINLNSLENYLLDKKKGILEKDAEIELRYDPGKTIVDGFSDKESVIIKHLITEGEIDSE